MMAKNGINSQRKTANAGHHACPLLLRNGNAQPLEKMGFPLGILKGFEYTEEEIKLEKGDILILMTDGITEARDSSGKLYSESGRLERIISGLKPDLSADAMVDAFIEDAMEYSGGVREDDMTVVVAKVFGL